MPSCPTPFISDTTHTHLRATSQIRDTMHIGDERRGHTSTCTQRSPTHTITQRAQCAALKHSRTFCTELTVVAELTQRGTRGQRRSPGHTHRWLMWHCLVFLDPFSHALSPLSPDSIHLMRTPTPPSYQHHVSIVAVTTLSVHLSSCSSLSSFSLFRPDTSPLSAHLSPPSPVIHAPLRPHPLTPSLFSLSSRVHLSGSAVHDLCLPTHARSPAPHTLVVVKVHTCEGR